MICRRRLNYDIFSRRLSLPLEKSDNELRLGLIASRRFIYDFI